MNTRSGTSSSSTSLFVTHWLPVLCWMGLIFLLSHQDKQASSRTSEWVLSILNFFHIDIALIKSYNLSFWVRKLAHFTEYLLLALLTSRLLRRLLPDQPIWYWVLLICVLYASSDEFHQRFVPGRGASIWDVGIDSLGSSTGIVFWTWWEGRKRRKRQNNL